MRQRYKRNRRILTARQAAGHPIAFEARPEMRLRSLRARRPRDPTPLALVGVQVRLSSG